MNIEHLRAFLEVAASGSFQLAADKLHITQSTVSARIKALEDRLNRTLLSRNRKGATLTSAGHHLHRHALTAVQAWERARQEIALPDDLTGIFSLGLQLNHWDPIAPNWMQDMQYKHPNIATRIVSDYSDSLMGKLREGLLDLAVLYSPQQRPNLIIETLSNERLIMVSTEPRSLKIGRVPGYVFVDWGEEFRTQHSLAFPEASIPRLSVGLGDVGLNHILLRGGSGYFLERSVEPLIAKGHLHRVRQAPVFQRPLFLAYPSETEDPQLQRDAVNSLHAALNLNQSQPE